MMYFFGLSLLLLAFAVNGEQSCARDTAGSCVPSSGATMMQIAQEFEDITKESDTDEGSVNDGLLEEDDGAGAATRRSWSEYTTEYTTYLEQMVCASDASKKPAVNELKELIGKFIAQQSNSEDKSSAQLMEAKHQLNDLHVSIDDLASEVNATKTTTQVDQLKLKSERDELAKTDEWKKKHDKKCGDTRESQREMLRGLKEEMEEMKQIANPGASMDVNGGAMLLQKPESTLSGILDAALKHPDALEKTKVSHVQGLVQNTKTAAASLSQCVQDQKKAPNKASTPEECAQQKEALEAEYSKTFKELSRLQAEYEDLVKSRACEDAVEEQYEERKTPIDRKIDTLVEKIEMLTQRLRELRPRLTDAKHAEKKLRKQVRTLTKQGADLPDTVSDLDKVRDTINALGDCPGLEKADLHIPVWTGEWAEVKQKTDQTDDQLDAAMEAACKDKFSNNRRSVRAAEVGEIMSGSIKGMPGSNTASSSILGACPLCAGDSDSDTELTHASKHARVCWDAGKEISSGNARKDCSQGTRAVLCVWDKKLRNGAAETGEDKNQEVNTEGKNAEAGEDADAKPEEDELAKDEGEEANCEDCAGRLRASTERGVNPKNGKSLAGASFCFKRNEELKKDPSVCLKYWGQMAESDDRVPCVKHDDPKGGKRCKAASLSCCSGSAK